MLVTSWGSRGWRRSLTGALAVLVIVGLSTVLLSSHRAAPAVESFYRAPATVPTAPGRLLRSTAYTRGIPATARAWRILYTTTTADGSATVASGFVLIGRHAPRGRHPVLAWAHGTSGLARDCAPTMLANPFGSGIREDLGRIIRKHWVLVATDYEGMGAYGGTQPYLVGSAEGRAVLDAVRAARSLKDVSASNRTVVWGHSQGGGAALWADKIQPTYAPDVPLSGVAAISPTSDLPAVARHWNDLGVRGAAFTAYLITAYADSYANVRRAGYVSGPERRVVRRISRQCVRQAERMADAVHTSDAQHVLDRSPDTGPLGARLRQNTPTALGTAPLLVAWGGADGLIPPSIQRRYVRTLCTNGEPVDRQQVAGRGHDSVLEGSSPLLPELIRWTGSRLAGVQPRDNCPVSSVGS